MVKKSLLIFFILCILVSTTTALNCGHQIRESITLTQGLSCEDTALVINGSQLTLDCANHVITGKGLGNGIEIIGSSVNIKNCEVQGFENGILMTKARSNSIDSSRIKDNLIGVNLFLSSKITLTGNEITNNNFYGIYSKDSLSIDKDNNIFGNNRQDYYELITEIEEEPEQPIQQQPQDTPPAEPSIEDEKSQTKPVEEPVDPNKVLSMKTIPVELPKEQEGKVQVKKSATVKPGKTEFDIVVTPKENLKSLQVTEKIPVEVAQKSEEITANLPFKVVEEGNHKHGPTITFDLAKVEEGEQKTVSYSIDKELLSEFVLRPTTFILLEEAINPGSLLIIRVLFSLTMILAAVTLYLSKTLHRHHHYLIHLAVFIIAIIIFITFNIKVEIVISEWVNNVLMTLVLVLTTLGFAITDIRYYRMLKSTPNEDHEIEELEF